MRLLLLLLLPMWLLPLLLLLCLLLLPCLTLLLLCLPLLVLLLVVVPLRRAARLQHELFAVTVAAIRKLLDAKLPESRQVGAHIVGGVSHAAVIEVQNGDLVFGDQELAGLAVAVGEGEARTPLIQPLQPGG
jgi:hypothetical protein